MIKAFPEKIRHHVFEFHAAHGLRNDRHRFTLHSAQTLGAASACRIVGHGGKHGLQFDDRTGNRTGSEQSGHLSFVPHTGPPDQPSAKQRRGQRSGRQHPIPSMPAALRQLLLDSLKNSAAQLFTGTERLQSLERSFHGIRHFDSLSIQPRKRSIADR
jgi:hypothetical protein